MPDLSGYNKFVLGFDPENAPGGSNTSGNPLPAGVGGLHALGDMSYGMLRGVPYHIPMIAGLRSMLPGAEPYQNQVNALQSYEAQNPTNRQIASERSEVEPQAYSYPPDVQNQAALNAGIEDAMSIASNIKKPPVPPPGQIGAAFRLPGGEVWDTGPFHDVSQLPEYYRSEPGLSHANAGAGFADGSRFWTREEANAMTAGGNLKNRGTPRDFPKMEANDSFESPTIDFAHEKWMRDSQKTLEALPTKRVAKDLNEWSMWQKLFEKNKGKGLDLDTANASAWEQLDHARTSPVNEPMVDQGSLNPSEALLDMTKQFSPQEVDDLFAQFQKNWNPNSPQQPGQPTMVGGSVDQSGYVQPSMDLPPNMRRLMESLKWKSLPNEWTWNEPMPKKP